jgi:hypothetical protein
VRDAKWHQRAQQEAPRVSLAMKRVHVFLPKCCILAPYNPQCCLHAPACLQDTLEPGKVTLAEQIIKAGLAELPQSMFMIVLHSSFLVEVQSSFQSGYTELQVRAGTTAAGFQEQHATPLVSCHQRNQTYEVIISNLNGTKGGSGCGNTAVLQTGCIWFGRPVQYTRLGNMRVYHKTESCGDHQGKTLISCIGASRVKVLVPSHQSLWHTEQLLAVLIMTYRMPRTNLACLSGMQSSYGRKSTHRRLAMSCPLWKP